MGADAVLVAAIGSALLLAYAAVVGTVLCLRALRHGGEFEMEIKAPSLAWRMRASRAQTGMKHGEDPQHGPKKP
jgi:hypothetical protein